MPKKFIFILIFVQAFLTFLQWLLYKMIVVVFPQTQGFSSSLEIAIITLSFTFLIFSTLTHFRENLFIRFGYIVASVWVVFAFYFAGTLAISLFVYLFSNAGLYDLGLLSLAITLALTVYGLINARLIKVINVTIALPNLNPFWIGKTAVLASDIHLGHVLKEGFAAKVVRKINHQKPEIVFIPGDFYDGDRTNFQTLADEFKKIKAPLGIYYSSGNHEMYAGYEQCERALKNAGVKVLEDTKVELHGLQIVGLAYRNESHESVKQRLEEIKIDTGKPSILLKHVPNFLEAVKNAGVSLQLSGHTHLGQVWPFRFITKKVFKGFDYGFKKLHNLQIFVSSGVGTWGPPMRVFTKSEIVKITFE